MSWKRVLTRGVFPLFLLTCLDTSSARAAGTLNLSRDLVALGIAAQNLVPNNPALDARPLFDAGLQYAKAHSLSLLTVDPGAFYFLTPIPSPNPARYTNIFEVHDLTIDFAGSMVYFKDPFFFQFALTECQRVTLKNVTTDYINPPYTHVRLSSVDAPNRRLSYQTLAGWPDPATFNGVTTPFGAAPPERWAVLFRNGTIVPGTSRTPVADNISGGVMQLLQDGAPWTQAATLDTLQAGDTIVLTFRGGGSPVQVFRGDAITLSNITVYGSSNWAVIFASTHNSVADRVRVMPRPGTGLVGSNADGIHFTNAGQNNHLRNSYVAGTVDDAIAFDSIALGTVLSQTGLRQLRVRRNEFLRLPNGVPMNFVNVVTTAEIAGAKIVSQNPPDTTFPVFGSEADLIFDQDLPTGLAPGSEIVFGSAYRGAGSTIEDNVIGHVLCGRGIWISGNIGLSVRRNTIGSTSNGGIVVSQDTAAFPGPPARDVMIHSNIVAGSLGPMASGTGTQTAVGAIIVESLDNLFRFGQLATNTNISIRSNYVADSGRTGIWIGELNGGAIEDNVIVRWNRHPQLPTWGMCCADLAMVLADFSQPLAVHFSSNLSVANNLTQLASSLSGPIEFPAPSLTVSGVAGAHTVGVVSVVPGFLWTAQSSAPWLTLTTTSGTGSGPLAYTVTPNRGAVARQATIVVAGHTLTVSQLPGIPTSGGDFDGDRKTDIGVFRPSTGSWYVRFAATGSGLTFVWGGVGDVPVVGDYDGDGTADIAVFRPSNGTWYVRYTATGALLSFLWGGAGDVPTQGDYDGDGKTDMAIFRPSTGTWYVRYTATGAGISLVWGGAGDVPTQSDYDGDGLTDIAIFRPSTGTWYVRYAATGTGISLVWGGAGDVPVPADYDGDGLTDIAIFRVSTGTWFIRYAATGAGITHVWGGGTDVPAVGDYDGDGLADIAIFRPSTGTWYVRYSATGASLSLVWGGSGDVPILKRP